jgi:RNA polymerase sigma-70 factor (ECF subfamily)
MEAYRKYCRFWLALARSTNIPEQDAEDIVHGVIASALSQSSKQFQSLEHIRNYVSRGVINRVIQHRHRADRQVRLTEIHEMAAAGKLDDGVYDLDRQREVLRSAILSLPDKDFEVLKYRYYAGLTFREISELLHLSISTLKSREDAAIRKIRRLFRKKGF